MAGQYRFKDINGNIVAQISASAAGAISFSGSAVDFSNASTITLGEVQLAGTASNALLLDGFDSTAFLFTSSFNTISQSISSQLTTLQTTSGSNIGRLNNLESKSSSVDISITNINSVTASNIARLTNLETKSASVDISVSSINSFTASNNITSLNSKTGSYATTGSNTFFGTQTFSGSVYIANDLVVQGSSSIQYISASSVSIGTNIVQLNTANPSVRFAGLTIIDSGSIGGSGSFLYDSVHDEFVFVHRGNGTNVTSSHFVLGPETYDSLGNETYLTCNIITKGTGKEHLVNSCIFDNGTTTCIKNDLIGTGTISGTNIYASTVSCSPIGCFGILCATYLYPSQISMGNTFIYAAGNRLGIGTANPLGVLSITGGQNSLSSLATYSSIEPLGIFNMFYLNSGTYPFYLDIAAIGDTTSTNGGSNIRFLTHCGTSGVSPVERMRITCGGFIGIGTTCPTEMLHLNNASTNAAFIRFQNTGGSGVYIGGRDNNMELYAGGTEKMKITCGGNIGIGTNSPCANLHVYCAADVWHTRIGSACGELRIGGDTASGAVIQSYTPAGVVRDLYIQRDGGNVGIGTNNPEGKLHITGVNSGNYGTNLVLVNCATAVGTATGIDFGVDASTAGCGLGNAQIKVINTAASNASDMVFSLYDGSSFLERFRIKSNGVASFAYQVCAPTLEITSTNTNVYPRVNRSSTAYETGWKLATGGTDSWYTGLRSADGVGSYHFYSYTTNTSVVSIACGGTVTIGGGNLINSSNNKAHTFCQLNSTNYSTKTFTFTGNTVSSFAVTDFSGIPSNAKAVQVYGWYHITGYSAGLGQGDHAMSWFGPATINNTTQWAGAGSGWPNGESTYTPRFHGTFVMEHDGDASIQTGNSGAMHYYGSWHQGTINVHTDGNIYYSIGAGISGGTHYNALVATGYWI